MLPDQEFERYWKEWSEKEEANYILAKNKQGKEVPKYLKKGYTHFDLRFWFPLRKEELKKLLKNNLRINNSFHKREEWWAFSPFLKILMKTPRYKYQVDEDDFDLETKIRPICFASHFDSLIFSFYAYCLTRKYESYIEEKGFSDCVLAYRSNLGGKCNIQFSKEVFDEVRKRQECTAIALDIKGYFDTIVHKTLKEKWATVLNLPEIPADQYKIFKALTEYSYVNKGSILRKYGIVLKKMHQPPKSLLELVPEVKDFEKFQRLRNDKLIVTNPAKNKRGEAIGIPQGSGMSALLSNIYLIDFDQELSKKAKKEGFLYRRYCDDILIVCDSDKAEALQKFTIDLISSYPYSLEIQQKKVEMTEFKMNSAGKIRAFDKKKLLRNKTLKLTSKNEKLFYKSLQYLGFEFNGQDVFIRASSLSRYFRKMKAKIVKTVAMAYNKKNRSSTIWKHQLLEKYSHLGKRNFIKYAFDASKKEYKNSKGHVKDGFDSPAIRKQVARHFSILMRTLGVKNLDRFYWKLEKKEVVNPKKI